MSGINVNEMKTIIVLAFVCVMFINEPMLEVEPS